MPPKASVFSIFDAYSEERLGSDRYEQVIEMARFADTHGYDTFWVAEHHFQLTGTLPSPPVFLAALARETSRIRMGPLVSVLPLHNPVELAEQYALVDRLSGGRLEIGVGSGNTPVDFQGFGVDMARRTELFDAAFVLFLKALKGEAIDAPNLPTGSVKLNVRPIQLPHPPLWVAAGRLESVRHVGAIGLNLALIPYATVDSIDELRDMIKEYLDALTSVKNYRVAAVFHVYIGKKERGLKALRRYIEGRKSARSVLYSSKVSRSSKAAEPEKLVENGLALIGQHEEVRKQLLRIRSTGVTDICGLFDFGGIPTDKVLSSMREFVSIIGSL
jgi:alkanesulfonate monooxygenase SsuD/methylene tetrahydromethanopterin reductase-like flavin-dependent oxidoreductase (luciferase family)